MKKLAIETLLLQEMEDVRGGAGGVCECQSGAYQGPDKDGECKCKSSAGQSTKPGSEFEKPPTCTCDPIAAAQ